MKCHDNCPNDGCLSLITLAITLKQCSNHYVGITGGALWGFLQWRNHLLSSFPPLEKYLDSLPFLCGSEVKHCVLVEQNPPRLLQ